MKRLGILIFASISILVAAVGLVHSQSSYGPSFLVEYNTDFVGRDGISVEFPVSNAGECMDECAASDDCQAFTFADIEERPPYYGNPRPLCWLINAVPEKRMSARLITGVRQ